MVSPPRERPVALSPLFLGGNGRMLVGTAYDGVDEQLLKVGIPLERLGDEVPDPVFFPAEIGHIPSASCPMPSLNHARGSRYAPCTARLRQTACCLPLARLYLSVYPVEIPLSATTDS